MRERERGGGERERGRERKRERERERERERLENHDRETGFADNLNSYKTTTVDSS